MAWVKELLLLWTNAIISCSREGPPLSSWALATVCLSYPANAPRHQWVLLTGPCLYMISTRCHKIGKVWKIPGTEVETAYGKMKHLSAIKPVPLSESEGGRGTRFIHTSTSEAEVTVQTKVSR
ncbi:unnamed protein product [Pleuronectes platessa]|uniref:Secreted protein n=1 Tax=Pleuronectes platessa TaxID=8262 RepID=A0A9N7UXB6_PLEPL|nr:unnamed protein product [Pleuronectes platessa]